MEVKENEKPGSELDALVAAKVMGFNIIPHEDGPTIECEDGAQVFVPAYSTDIAAAWEIINKLDESDFYALIKQRRGKITCTLEQYERDAGGNRESHTAIGNTVPHAICLAALMTVNQ